MDKNLIEKAKQQVENNNLSYQLQKNVNAQSLVTFANGKQRQLVVVDGDYYINLRSEQPANIDIITREIARLTIVFSDTKAEFWNEAIGAVEANKMSEKQLKSRVDYLIQEHPYPSIRVSDIVKNCKNKCYTYSEMLARMGDNGTDDFEAVKIVERTFWIDKREIK